MNIKKILCPYDFSVFSEAANQFASVMAQANDAQIVYLHVAQPEIPFASYEYVNVERDEKEVLEQLEKIEPTLNGIPVEYAVRFGLPSDQIVEYANEHDVDLIVLGTHGRTGLKRALMGSVAEAVVRQADCLVLAVKADSKVPSAVE